MKLSKGIGLKHVIISFIHSMFCKVDFDIMCCYMQPSTMQSDVPFALIMWNSVIFTAKAKCHDFEYIFIDSGSNKRWRVVRCL